MPWSIKVQEFVITQNCNSKEKKEGWLYEQEHLVSFPCHSDCFWNLFTQAIEKKRLFIIDYHDVLLPFIENMNSLPGRKAYASRTIFFYTRTGFLRPIAIELSLPPTSSSPGNKRVYTHGHDNTTHWIWKLAKAHVCSNDAGVHQLVNHWWDYRFQYLSNLQGFKFRIKIKAFNLWPLQIDAFLYKIILFSTRLVTFYLGWVKLERSDVKLSLESLED